jgi:Holliday junction resolvasome RuvABC endonuclease subunit
VAEKTFDGGLMDGESVAIGIDQSLTGFAFSAVSVSNPTHHETWVYKSPYMGVQRLADIQDWLAEKFDYLNANSNSITDIAMEAPFLGSPSTLPLSELASAVKLFLYDYFYSTTNYVVEPSQHLRTPLIIPPMTLKKFATGKGNSKKQEMLLQIFKRWGVEFNDDNAADAYALGRLASGNSITEVEKAVVEQVKDPKYRDRIS